MRTLLLKNLIKKRRQMKLQELKSEKIKLQKEAAEVENRLNELTKKIDDYEKEVKHLELDVQKSDTNMKRCLEAHIKGELDIADVENSKKIHKEVKKELEQVRELVEATTRLRRQADLKLTQLTGTVPQIQREIYSFIVGDLKSKLQPDLVHKIFVALHKSGDSYFNYPTLLSELFPPCPDERRQEILAGLDKEYEL